jgi:hypothetical protein
VIGSIIIKVTDSTTTIMSDSTINWESGSIIIKVTDSDFIINWEGDWIVSKVTYWLFYFIIKMVKILLSV